MSEHQTCLLCGAESHDVAMGLVELPEAERGIVRVPIPVTFRDGAVEEVHEVREQYARMPRCRDHEACAARVVAIEAAEKAKREPAEVVL